MLTLFLFSNLNCYFQQLFLRLKPKSLKFGYWPYPETNSADFGERAEDIIKLNEINHQDKNRLTDSDNRFHIAVISDSYGWGDGIRESDRYSVLLEKALDKISPTTVLSLSSPGDSMLEHLIKYRLLTIQNYDIDLYIFGILHNDLMFENFNKYNLSIAQSIISDSGCNPELVYFKNNQIEYQIDLANSFNPQYANLCVFKSLLAQLPKENAIYMDYGQVYNGEIQDNPYYEHLIKPLQENNFYLISADDLLKDIEEPRLYVSQKESHPSKFANQLFADLLFKEIMQNPRWHFPSTPHE